MPPRLLELALATPLTLATTGVPLGARMSLPWCDRPPGRGWPQSLENECGPCTGQIQLPVAMMPVARDDDGAARRDADAFLAAAAFASNARCCAASLFSSATAADCACCNAVYAPRCCDTRLLRAAVLASRSCRMERYASIASIEPVVTSCSMACPRASSPMSAMPTAGALPSMYWLMAAL